MEKQMKTENYWKTVGGIHIVKTPSSKTECALAFGKSGGN